MRTPITFLLLLMLWFDASGSDKFSGKTVKNRAEGMELTRLRANNAPKIGELAPDFILRSPEGKKSVRLSKLVKEKPLVLVFGSST